MNRELFQKIDKEAREAVSLAAAGEDERFTAVVDRAWKRVNEW